MNWNSVICTKLPQLHSEVLLWRLRLCNRRSIGKWFNVFLCDFHFVFCTDIWFNRNWTLNTSDSISQTTTKQQTILNLTRWENMWETLTSISIENITSRTREFVRLLSRYYRLLLQRLSACLAARKSTERNMGMYWTWVKRVNVRFSDISRISLFVYEHNEPKNDVTKWIKKLQM